MPWALTTAMITLLAMCCETRSFYSSWWSWHTHTRKWLPTFSTGF